MVLQKVKTFDDLNESNNPYRENDFGLTCYNGEKIFFKIDDYAGHAGYNLVLTVLLTEEY